MGRINVPQVSFCVALLNTGLVQRSLNAGSTKPDCRKMVVENVLKLIKRFFEILFLLAGLQSLN